MTPQQEKSNSPKNDDPKRILACFVNPKLLEVNLSETNSEKSHVFNFSIFYRGNLIACITKCCSKTKYENVEGLVEKVISEFDAQYMEYGITLKVAKGPNYNEGFSSDEKYYGCIGLEIDLGLIKNFL